MRAPNPNNSADRRRITAGLLLVVAVSFLALWTGALSHKTLPKAVGDASDGTPPSPAVPLVHPASGNLIQGPFTLSFTNHTHDGQIPPDLNVQNSGQFILAAEAAGNGTELWIKYANGLGIQTLTLPAKPGQFDFHYGNTTLRIIREEFERFPGHKFLSVSPQWLQSDRKTPLAVMDQPYDAIVTWTRSAEGRRRDPHLYLVPRHLAQEFSITAQTLNSAGHPNSTPISLIWQPVTQNLLFVQIPSAYSADTKQLAITIFNRDEPNVKAHWVFADLPTSKRTLDSSTPPRTQTQIGPLTIKATVTEASDVVSSVGQIYQQNDLRMPGVMAADPFDRTNFDGHVPTGIPTLRCVVQAQNHSKTLTDEWRLSTDAITPQWSAVSNEDSPPGNANTSNPAPQMFLNVPANNSQQIWAKQELRYGVAYPKQQKIAEISGSAVKIATRNEKLTFHDADVVYNPASKRWQIVWNIAQTLTSTSGVDVITLNPRTDTDTRESATDSTNAGAELWLAWHVPETLSVSTGNSDQSLDTPQIQRPVLASPFHAEISEVDVDNSHTLWHSVWMPGAPPPSATLKTVSSPYHPRSRLSDTPVFGFMQANYEPLRLWVTQPPVSKASLMAQILGNVPPCPLPHHLKDVTVILKIRYEAESHPFKLIVPVSRLQ